MRLIILNPVLLRLLRKGTFSVRSATAPKWRAFFIPDYAMREGSKQVKSIQNPRAALRVGVQMIV